MPKKSLCPGLWAQIFEDTKLFAHQVLDKLTPHSNASSSSSSTYSGSTVPTHGRTMDQSRPHHHQQQEQQQCSSSQEQQQQQSKQTPYQYQQHHHQPPSPHLQEIYTPYRHVYYSSTLSINVRTTSSSSCTSLASTLNSSSFSSLTSSGGGQEQEYESLWEVQLALREIPGMIEGNILESCQQDSTAVVGPEASMSSSSILWPPLPLPLKSQMPSSSLPSNSADTQSQASSLRRTFATMEEFPRFPSITSDDSNIDNDYYSESDDDEENEIDEVESLTFQPLPLQPLPLHPFLQLYSPLYHNCTTSSLDLPFTTAEHSSNSINNKYNTGSFFLSIEPRSPRNEEEEEEEEAALTFSRRQFRGYKNKSNANDTPPANTNNGHGNPRSDRKDSGVFIHDAEDGTIVKISPRSTYSLSASESESESEIDHIDDSCCPQHYRLNKDLSSENTALRSRWMNGVSCIPSNTNTNTNISNVRGGGGGGDRDDMNKSSKTTLQRRESIASTSFSSPPSTAFTAMTFASASASSTATATSPTFPSLLAAVSFISLQA
ncbi:MAG: hypothetical protein J3R72DRAFT_187092 [Linnemannia gamsii]|nr:MAG: hypothetical protein J3R72DRAFT_187092 [Linnemannia gamsii]